MDATREFQLVADQIGLLNEKIARDFPTDVSQLSDEQYRQKVELLTKKYELIKIILRKEPNRGSVPEGEFTPTFAP